MRRCRHKPAEMKFVKFLGKGSYGSIHLFSNTKADGSSFYSAVKVSDDWTIEREFRILTELKGCRRIVQLFEKTLVQETDHNGNRVYKMPMEYAAAGTLSNFIQRNRNLSDPVIKDFTRMILQGLVSVHHRGYVHCDLKPDNLLLFPHYDKETWDCSYELKIADFGLSLKAGEEESDCWEIDSPFVGTPVYMSPESVDDGTVEKALDLWSLGCIVLEMYTGKHPWFGVNVNDLQGFLADGKAPEIPETVPLGARQFLEKCFSIEPKERGSASELLLHPFLIGEVKMADVAGGETRRMGLRTRKPPMRFEDVIITKKPLKVKFVSSNLPQFKKVSNKPLKLKILPPRPPKSSFVPVH
ncbi:unnamed protein product [Thlaspi arvense]|uniref:Protein kinase domain-containing protein n=1 Tax=Thlaspi arvense TaxID=13288 RepID=A0AAU9S999_THLAR|nr:unnamed protein product [Thlaspi arvense]